MPPTLQGDVLKLCHYSPVADHFGFVKTLHFVERQFWWPGFHKDVSQYISSCLVCLMAKNRGGKPQGLLQPLPTPTRLWLMRTMDFIMYLPLSKGKTVIWVVVDSFSKQAHYISCASMPTAKGLARLFMHHMVRLHGFPDKIISHRGSQFITNFWQEFLD